MVFWLVRQPLTVGCAIAVALVLACTGDRPQHTSVTGQANGSAHTALPLRPCQVENVDGDARCGWYTVWENRAASRGRRIALRVIVLSARHAISRSPDPIFVLTGGPGIGVATEASTANLVGAARDDRDVVLVDQRGTGASSPLSCDLYGRGFAPYLGDRFPADAAHRCRDSLARRADLTQYTSSIAADDLDEVRAALGYERVNLVGFSYGSKLAQVYLRKHPTRVRRLVLDGAITTAYVTPLPAAEAGANALRAVFADCAAQPRCAQAYPRLEAEFRRGVARLDSAPASVTLNDDMGLGRERVVLTRRAFQNGVWSHLYSATEARDIPRMIHRVAHGDFDYTARRIAMFNATRWPRFAAGAMLAILCTEDAPFLSMRDVARADSSQLLGAPVAGELAEACEGWPRGALPAGYREPVRSEVPALILSGALDPISPTEWGASAARSLTRSTRVVRPGAGHLDEDDCTLRLLADFITRSDPDGLDVSCARRSRREVFWVR